MEIKKPGRGWNLAGLGGNPEFYFVHITYEMPLRHHPGGVKDGHKNVKLKGGIGVGVIMAVIIVQTAVCARTGLIWILIEIWDLALTTRSWEEQDPVRSPRKNGQ